MVKAPLAEQQYRPDQVKYLQNGQNPKQSAWDNLPAAAATRVVGGMSSHWTCCTPRQHPKIERSTIFNDEEWESLYTRAEKLFNTDSTLFDKSIRQQLVKHVLEDAYKDKKRELRSMPLAGQRNAGNKDYVEWSCTATILGDLAEPCNGNEKFELRANTQCVRFQLDEAGQIRVAVVKDIMEDREYFIIAKKYVVCAGAVLTPGILFNSEGLADRLPALVSRRPAIPPPSFTPVLP